MISQREILMALVDSDSLQPSDAIILLEGDGLNRYQHAVSLYQEGYAPLIVFSGGIENYAYGSYPFSKIKHLILKCGIAEENLLFENKSLQTKQQGDEIIKFCIKNNWSRIILVASNYHQYRAYLTFLKSMQEQNLQILIYNSPVALPWFSYNDWGTRIECLKGEFDRIEEYMSKGDLLNYNDAIKYQEWKEQSYRK
jgi:uncharacterized SAM-binding protein YcdF (DUF218 family)